jgi:CO/xanthine dehydrogenase FAD-binding subunit
MLLPEFEYHEPSSVKAACVVMAELGDCASPLAGGTDLLVKMKRKILAPSHVVSLGKLEELKNLETSEGTFKIGALVTVARIAQSEELETVLPALCQGALNLGSPLVRNIATAGGNIVSARPAADLPPALMAYGARVSLANEKQERSFALEDFFKGPGETVMESGELLTQIQVDIPPPHSGASYIKLGTRRALEISLVSVASFIALDGPDGVMNTARIVMGAVGPKPLRAFSAENLLVGERPSEHLFEAAGKAAAGDSMPIDDFRGSAEYRRAMVSVLTMRTLTNALDRARRHQL